MAICHLFVKDYIQNYNHNNESNNITIHHYIHLPPYQTWGGEPQSIIT